MTRLSPTLGRRRRPGGFTLIEILIVVFILGLLTTLLVVGVKHLTLNAKRQQTRAALAKLSSLYAEWQITAKQTFLTGPMPAPGNVTVELAGSPGMGGGDRFGPAVWFTRDLMWHLQQNPTTLAALGKLPPSALMAFPANQGLPYAAGYAANQYSANGTYRPFQAADFGRVYLMDFTVSTTWVYYDCIQANGPPGLGNPPPVAPPTPPAIMTAPISSFWFQSYPATINSNGPSMTPASDTPPVSVPLDAWGNPIVFVPGGQLGTAGSPLKSGSPQTAIALPNGVASPDGKAFFASAGPDGDFSLADDNLYSFEK